MASKFRTRNRVPVATWIHPESGATLLRSSQPTVGTTGKRNEVDETYLKIVRDMRYPNAPKLLIFDARYVNQRCFGEWKFFFESGPFFFR